MSYIYKVYAPRIFGSVSRRTPIHSGIANCSIFVRVTTFSTAVHSRSFVGSNCHSMPAITTPAVAGDLNNTSAMRLQVELEPDAAYFDQTLEISSSEDETEIRSKYRPFLHDAETTKHDWISKLELSTAMKMAEDDLNRTKSRLKILMLYGSMRSRSVLMTRMNVLLNLLTIEQLVFQTPDLRSSTYTFPHGR